MYNTPTKGNLRITLSTRWRRRVIGRKTMSGRKWWKRGRIGFHRPKMAENECAAAGDAGEIISKFEKTNAVVAARRHYSSQHYHNGKLLQGWMQNLFSTRVGAHCRKSWNTFHSHVREKEWEGKLQFANMKSEWNFSSSQQIDEWATPLLTSVRRPPVIKIPADLSLMLIWI